MINRQATAEQIFLKQEGQGANKLIRLSAIFACLGVLFTIAIAWFITRIVDNLVFQHKTIAFVAPDFCKIVFLFIGRSVFFYGADQTAYTGATRVKQKIREKLLQNILYRFDLSDKKAGSLINNIVEGVEALHGYYALTLPSRITATFIPLLVFLFIARFNMWATLVLCVTAPLIPVFMIWIGRGAEKKTQSQWKRLSHMSGHFLDMIQGFKTLRLFNATAREERLIYRICDDLRIETMGILKIAFLSSLALEFFTTVSIAMIAVLIGFRLLWHEMTFFDGFFVLMLAPEFYAPLRKMGTHYHAKMEALGAAEKIAELVELKTKKGDAKKEKIIITVIRSIEFKNVNFSYHKRAILRNINFTLVQGDYVGLTGPSGVGKTTLFKLLLGLIEPDSGYILINGHDLQDIDKNDYWSLLGWIPQQAHLFPGSVIDNILCSMPEACKEDIKEIIDDCVLDEFIDAHITENSTGLSGGQVQRVAIARALVRRPSLYLLDEPTAHLDKVTEGIIYQALEKYKGDSIIFFSSHRQKLLDQVQRLFTLEYGHLIEWIDVIS